MTEETLETVAALLTQGLIGTRINFVSVDEAVATFLKVRRELRLQEAAEQPETTAH